MSRMFDCIQEPERSMGIKAAVEAVRAGELVVMPTDTVYGIGADAFTPHAVASLLAAKRRGRDMPVPVLVGSRQTVAGLVSHLPDYADDLIEEFWPGGLTLVVAQAPSLRWDLGEAGGTVAVRMPDHPIALEVLRETGPMAVSSANVSGQPPATSAKQAREQLGDFVDVYLESGVVSGSVASTIVDVSGAQPRVLRAGAVSIGRLRTVVPDVLD